jgi:predicted dehydrogenase
MTQAPASPSFSQAQPKIRVGVIGVGNWALHGHLRVLDLLPEYEVTALYSQRQDAARAAAERFGVKTVAASLDALVNDPNVDLVAVLTTAPQHAEGVRAAIAAGKDVYSEWPLTPSTEVSQELVDLAKARGVRHVVGLQRRLSATNRYVKDLIDDGFVGKLRSVRLHVSMNYFQARRSNSLRWTVPPENFSHVIAIYAGHFLDALFATVGAPRTLAGLAANQFGEVTIVETGEVFQTTTPDQLVLHGALDNGALFSAHIEGGKRNGSGVQIDITGDAGDLKITNVSAFGGLGEDYVIEGAHGDNLALGLMPVPESYDWLPDSDLPSSVLELANLYAAFAQDVAKGTTTAPTFEAAVQMHHILDLSQSSSDAGHRAEFAA